jgi:hypothetical protein
MKNLIDTLIQSPEMLFFVTFWGVIAIASIPFAIKEYIELSKLQDEIDRMNHK